MAEEASISKALNTRRRDSEGEVMFICIVWQAACLAVQTFIGRTMVPNSERVGGCFLCIYVFVFTF